MGRDWLNYLQYIIEPKLKGKSNNTINTVEKEITKPNQKWKRELKKQFPELFERRGKIKHHKIHARLYKDTVVKQQKGRRVPIQLQESEKTRNKQITTGRSHRQSK